MIIILKRSFGGTGITIDQQGSKIPTLTAGSYELKEGEDYTIENVENEAITEIVFEWMGNQSVHFRN